MTSQLTSRVITLTPDELARWERGERHWIVRCDCCLAGTDVEDADPVCHQIRCSLRRWRDAVGPCPTCWGDDQLHTYTCSDCRGTGLLLTELRAACGECEGTGTLDLSADDYLAAGIGWADGADDRPGLEDCHDCSGEGSVLVATVSVEVLPVVDRDTMAGATATGPRVIVVRPYLGVGGGTYLSTQSHVSLDLDPLPTPGRDFVVVPTEVPA